MKKPFGLSAALALPVNHSGAIDLKRLADHAAWCLASGCGSVTVFGTTGEGASLGNVARAQILGALAGAGIDLGRSVYGGVAASAMQDAVLQVRLLMDSGCRGVLLAPPFYFKGVTDDGLFNWFAELFEKLGPQARDIILYNIPSVTAVTLSIPLITRLRAAFPDIIIGVKDSSGDYAYTQTLLAAHNDIAILIGDERYLAASMKLGAEGAISGMANLCPGDLRDMIQTGKNPDHIAPIVETLISHPVIPAVKALIAHRTGDAVWANTLPPLTPLGKTEAAQLCARWDAIVPKQTA